MITYRNIKNGLDFAKAFKEHEDNIAYLERKTKRLKKERDTYKKSVQELAERYKTLSIQYHAVVRPSCCSCTPW